MSRAWRGSWIDLKMESAVQKCCIEAIEQAVLCSAHDVSDGGMVVALAECCIGGEKPLGVRIESREMIRGDALLFSESQSRIIVSVKEVREPIATENCIPEAISVEISIAS